jgi:hypothetical protein
MNTPKLFGVDVENWARRLTQYLDTIHDKLSWKRGDEKASENGILMWDESIKSPVVSKDGEFRPLVIQDGSGMAYSNTNITAAAINTAYDIAWDGIANADEVSLLNSTEIHFVKGGMFLLAFSVQITSGNSSLKNLWFWPAINGTDVAGSTMKISIDTNSGTVVMSRSALFSVSAGDYLEARWATSDTAVTLEAHAAETFCPATPSVTLSVTRIHQ